MTAPRSAMPAHLERHVAATRRLAERAGQVRGWGYRLATVLAGGGRLLAAGNGGSAAQAQHLTAELVGRFDGDRRGFSAICLSAETSSLTAILNDYSAEEVFARQVEAHGRPGDLLALFSTSGRSPNVVAAAGRAHACGVNVVAFTGPLPNPLAAAADDAVWIDSPSTATIQELHLVAVHLMCAAFEEALTTVDGASESVAAGVTDGVVDEALPTLVAADGAA